MVERSPRSAPAPAGTASRWRCRWPEWAGYAAAGWSLLYGALGLYWSFGGAGFPFGRGNDPQAALSILEGTRAATAAPVIAGLGLAGAAIAVAMARGRGRGILRTALLAFAWAAAAVLVLLIPDYRLLMAAAYVPLFVLGAPFDWPPGSFFDIVTWPVTNQVLCVVGGLCWAGAAVAYQRRTGGACPSCGRGDEEASWTTPAAAARWGRWATAVAVLIPLIYAATRWAWALGIPLGITEEFLREGQAVGLWWAGAGLATVAVGGAVLTLGLVQPWGEVFPRWIPWLAGREDWAALAPELLWPLWGVALAAATLAYYFRRRGPCPRCGRG
jgi:hypothetical protein